MDEDSSDESEEVFADKKTKKRKSHGRMAEVAKKIKLSSHEPGPPCRCRMQCCQKMTKEAQKKILQNFNLLESHDAQNSYLSGLISVLPVKRVSKNDNARHYDAVYKYRVLAMEGFAKEIPVCKKAFMSIHGISKKKVQYLVSSLKKTGFAPTDKRGKHGKHLKLDDEIKSRIREQINSFKGMYRCLKFCFIITHFNAITV